METFEDKILGVINEEVGRIVREVFDEIDSEVNRHTQGGAMGSIIGGSAFINTLQSIRLAVLKRHGICPDAADSSTTTVSGSIEVTVNKPPDKP